MHFENLAFLLMTLCSLVVGYWCERKLLSPHLGQKIEAAGSSKYG